MISVEDEVFEVVEKALHEKFPDMGVYPEYPHKQPIFPCATVIEVENNVMRATRDSSHGENHAIISYEINIYSNKSKGKKDECKAIATIVDDALIDLGFNRTMLSAVPSIDGATIYRMIGRYQATVDKNKTIYRR